MEKFDLVPLLDYIDPAMLDYNGWVQVGMALKHEGYSVDDWDTWSQRDSTRYHDGECERKWNGFDDDGQIVTGATITKMAKDGGWTSAHSKENQQTMGWDDAVEAEERYNPTIDKDYKLLDTSYMDGEEIKPPEVWNPAKQITDFLKAVFEPGDIVGFVINAYAHEKDGKTKYVPSDQGIYTWSSGEIEDALRRNGGDVGAVLGDPDPEAGAWCRLNPLDGNGVKNDNVAEFKYALVESDSIPVSLQHEIYRKLELPIAALTYTGGKSLHAIVKVDATSYPQYKERVDYLYSVLDKNGMRIDKQNKNPSRLTRMPGFQRGEKKQFLVATHIGKTDWEEWHEYIEDMNDNLPEIENLEGLFDKPIELAPELISGILRQGHKLLLAGPSKAGKSFALINLVLSIANGRAWMGFPCQQGRVLYVNLELDGRSAKQRFVDITDALGYDHKNIVNVDIWNLRGKSTPMDKLTPKLIRRAKDMGYIAIVIDPIYKVLTGDENSAKDMADFVNQFDKVATELDCAVIYAHHHSKGAQGSKSSIDRSSGSGVFARDPDAILDLTELPVDEARYDKHAAEMACVEMYKTIATFRPDYLKEITPDDMTNKDRMGHHVMVAIHRAVSGYEQIMQDNARRVREAEEKAYTQTAWRLSAVLREFASPKPRNFWFDYPIHREDDSLADISLDDNYKKNGRSWKEGMKEANKKRSEEKAAEFEQAFRNLDFDGTGGPVLVDDLVKALDISDRAIYRRIKKSEKFVVSRGEVWIKSPQESKNDSKN